MPGRREGQKVYHELDPTFYSATSSTFIGSIYTMFGLQNIADGAHDAAGGYPQLSAEYVVGQAPDLIVLADTKCCEQTAADRGPAARRSTRSPPCKNGQVLAADDDIASRWGPRVADFAESVADDAEGLRSALDDGDGGPRRPPDHGRAGAARPAGAAGPGLCSPAARARARRRRAGRRLGRRPPPAAGRRRRHPARPCAGRWASTCPAACSGTQEAVLLQLRLPRVLLAALVGAGLAVAGAAYQGVFRNPLADPYLLGAAAGAGLGATLVIAYSPVAVASGPFGIVPLAAFAGALVGVGCALALGTAAGGSHSPTLLLAGIAVAAFLAAGADPRAAAEHRRPARRSTAGSSASSARAQWSDIALVLPYLGVGVRRAAAAAAAPSTCSPSATTRPRSLGVHPGRLRLLVIVAASLATAAAVAVSGLIGFVGLVVPAHRPPASSAARTRACCRCRC